MARTARSPVPASLLPADRVRQESLRLLLQAALYDPLTIRFLVDAGLRRGMRVLDVGSGLGSVSMLVSEIIGQRGAVVGIDCSAAMVELAERRARRAGKTNIKFLHCNAELPKLAGPFDAVVGRFVLRELHDRARALNRLAGLLEPGGIVAFQEKVLTLPVTTSPLLAAVERARTWMDQARDRAGVEVSIGAKLPQVFVAAGLSSPQLRLDAPVGHGPDWVGYDYLVESLRGMLPVIQLYGLASEQEMAIDTLAVEMRTEATKAAGIVILTPCIGAWAVQTANGHARTRRS